MFMFLLGIVVIALVLFVIYGFFAAHLRF